MTAESKVGRREELEKLRDRVAKATGPDRELDVAIACALCGFEADGRTVRPVGRAWWSNNWREIKAFTGSIDAAVTLVRPEGVTWSIDWEPKDRPDRRATAEYYLDGREIISQEHTPALALCAARLEYELAALSEGK